MRSKEKGEVRKTSGDDMRNREVDLARMGESDPSDEDEGSQTSKSSPCRNAC